MNLTLHNVYKKNNRKEGCGSHTHLSDEEVLQLVKDNWENRIDGDTKDCSYVPVKGADWFTPEIKMQTGDLMVGEWAPRHDVENDVHVYHEYAMVDTDKKTRAKSCFLVVYELMPGDFSLVTALATHGDCVPPMNLMTALRNVFCDRLPMGGGGSPIEKLKTAEDKLDYIFDVFMFWNVDGLAQPAPKELMDRIKKELK